MLERVQEQYRFKNGALAEIYRLPRKASYVCRIIFPNGEIVHSIDQRLSWTTMDGARNWARKIVEGA